VPKLDCFTLAQFTGVLESHLDGRDWLVGNNPTIADVANYAYIAHAPPCS